MRSLTNCVKSLIFGLSLPFRAAALIATQPMLLLASLVPLFLSIGLDAWIIHRAQAMLAGWIHSHLSGTYEWVANIFAWLAVFIAGIVAFSFIAGIAALPFNDWLAELTESRAEPPLVSTGRISLTGKARHLAIDLAKTVCAMTMSLLALFVTWIPGLNLAGLILTFLLIAFQFLSFPQTRRDEGVAAGVHFIFNHFWSCLGFGMSFAFLFALPLISSFALPLAVVGGTMLYARERGGRGTLPAKAAH